MPVDFWDNAIILIFFVYGLAFYSLGLALLVESGRSSELGFARSMRLLAAFGLLHGIHEWVDIFDTRLALLIDVPVPDIMLWLHLIFLITSFVALVAFGEHLLARERTGTEPTWALTLGTMVLFTGSGILVPIVYGIDDAEWRMTLDVLARYTIGIPGALISTRALWYQRQAFIRHRMADFASWLNWAIAALFIYGTIGQMFTVRTVIFPSTIINNELFLETMGFPVQLLRAVLACVLAVSMIRVLRALDFENKQRLEQVEEAQRRSEHERAEMLAKLNAELKDRAETRERWLQQITAAQEAERQRIARELHDDTGQVLTGIAMALRGLATVAAQHPETQSPAKTATRLTDLEHMATDALGNLRRLINDLRPPQLDELGLVSTLRSMQERVTEAWGRKNFITIQVVGEPHTLSKETEITLYRIAQEAVTNALKHAQAEHIHITLDYTPCLSLSVRDDGCGFELDKVYEERNGRTAWGLYGMKERAHLINADLEIESVPGQGTHLRVQMRESYCRDEK